MTQFPSIVFGLMDLIFNACERIYARSSVGKENIDKNLNEKSIKLNPRVFKLNQ